MIPEHLGYEYLLGDAHPEIDRLSFQHSVWGPVTRRFFDRLGVGPGWRCLDVGAGPGLVTLDLRGFVGDTGEVTALEPSATFRTWLTEQVRSHRWTNLNIVAGTSYEIALPPRYFDLIFVRWVIGFVPDPAAFLAPLLPALKPGGIIAVQDYVHHGCALFPEGGPWDAFPELMRRWWRSGGGDPYVAAHLPPILTRLGLKVIDYTPTTLTGGPDSPVMEWMERFLVAQLPVMVERGLASAEEADLILADWRTHRGDRTAVFFSPFVVDVAAR